MNKENIKKSKFLSKILRHNPESAGITLDKHGWANVKDILHKCSLKMPELESIVETNDKKRFEFDQHKMRIRARQGHSIEVDVELKEVIPTEDLLPIILGSFRFQMLKWKLSGFEFDIEKEGEKNIENLLLLLKHKA